MPERIISASVVTSAQAGPIVAIMSVMRMVEWKIENGEWKHGFRASIFEFSISHFELSHFLRVHEGHHATQLFTDSFDLLGLFR